MPIASRGRNNAFPLLHPPAPRQLRQGLRRSRGSSAADPKITLHRLDFSGNTMSQSRSKISL